MVKDSSLIGLSGPQLIQNGPVINTVADVLSLPFMLPFTLVNSVMTAITTSMSQMMFANMVTLSGTTQKSAKPAITPIIPQRDTMNRYKTKRVDRTNYQLLIGALDLITLDNAYGKVVEFLVKSSSSDFSIIIKVDDEEEYQRSWTEMSTLSDDVDGIVASLQDGYYILSMSDIHFSNNIKLTLSGRGLTFSKLYAEVKYAKLG